MSPAEKTRSNLLLRLCCWHVLCLVAAMLAATCAPIAVGQQVSSDMYSGMRWRLIGPHRAGRVTAVAGIAGQPNEYYFGTPGGGVWKTIDGGRVWKPIFDDAHVASIGAIAVAPSQPRTIYVGTGEQTRGNGAVQVHRRGGYLDERGPRGHTLYRRDSR